MSDTPRTDSIPDNEALAIGHDYQASAILRDPEQCPHFSDEGRRDVAYALQLLAIMERTKPGNSPWTAVLEELATLRARLAAADAEKCDAITWSMWKDRAEKAEAKYHDSVADRQQLWTERNEANARAQQAEQRAERAEQDAEICAEKSYLLGLKAGWRMGIYNATADFNAAVAGRQREIYAAIDAARAGEKP